MEKAHSRFQQRGIALAALSYDNVATLRDFSARKNIHYPLLSDVESKVIGDFHMIDPDDSTSNIPAYGAKHVSYPGWFFFDRDGVLKERFIDPFWGDRYTANNVIARLFPELIENRAAPVKTPQLSVVTAQSDTTASPGSRVTLSVEIELPEKMHLYAPGAQGYKPVELILDPGNEFEARPALYPRSEILRLEAIGESAPVYRGKVRISQDVVMSFRSAFTNTLPKDGTARTVEISGHLRYQACDDRTCFRPAEMPLKWRIDVHRNDQERPKPENQRPVAK